MNHTVLIEITSEKAIGLLRELEELHLIKVLRKDTQTEKSRLSDKYRSVFTKMEAASFNEHTRNMRKEWDNT
jgi:hypothetical protein